MDDTTVSCASMVWIRPLMILISREPRQLCAVAATETPARIRAASALVILDM